MGNVQFNQIPANLRVPLFYAEINAGQAPYQGPCRLLLVGQRTSDASAAANVPVIYNDDAQALCGVGSMLTEMAVWARQNDPFGEIWVLPIADPSGAKATQTITVSSSIAGSVGSVQLYIGGEKIEIAVASTDAEGDVAANLSAAINLGYFKFGRPLSFPVVATVSTNVVTLTARHYGTLGNKIDVSKNLVGDEGKLQQYLTIAAGTAGTGVPTLGTALAALGDIEFDYIASPYSDTTSLNTIKDFLDGVSGRWSPMQQIYGHHITAQFDTYSNLASFGSGRNDPNASIMGVVNSPSPPWRWAAAIGGKVHSDKNLGGEVDQAYRISQPVQTLELVGIQPPQLKTNWFSKTQRNVLYQDGIAGFTVEVDGTVQLDRLVTTYRLNSYSQPDITWLDIETRLQMVYFARYMRQRITQKYGRCVLVDDNPTGNPGIVSPKILKAECVHAYKELETGGLVENSTAFAQALVLERSSDPNRVNAYLPVDVANQFRVFAANITTFLQYPAA